MNDNTNSSTNISAIDAVQNQRLSSLERRCDEKEKKIDILTAWQNRAIGYLSLLSFLITIVMNYISK